MRLATVSGQTDSMMWQPGLRCAAALGMLVAAAGVIACGTADRSTQAQRIRTAIRAMPGVDSVDPGYINDFENGANLKIELGMSSATEQQIADAADRIRQLKGADFAGYRQEADFIVTDGAVVKRSAEIDPGEIAADAGVLRRLRAVVPDGSLEWSRDGTNSRLEMWDVNHPDDALTAARATLAGRADTIYIPSAQPEAEASWDATLPLNAEQQLAIIELRNGLPVIVYESEVRDGRISGLSVGLGAPPIAYHNAVTMIAALSPTRTRPVHVQWRLAGAQPSEVGEFTACAMPSTAVSTPLDFSQLRTYFETQYVGCAN